MTIDFAYYPPPSIESRAASLRLNIQLALDRNFSKGNAEHVIDRLKAGEAGVLSILEDGRETAQCVMDWHDTNRGLYLRVISLTGDGMDLWLGELVDILRTIADDGGAHGVTFAGRVGWNRVLKQYGFETVQTIMALEV